MSTCACATKLSSMGRTRSLFRIQNRLCRPLRMPIRRPITTRRDRSSSSGSCNRRVVETIGHTVCHVRNGRHLGHKKKSHWLWGKTGMNGIPRASMGSSARPPMRKRHELSADMARARVTDALRESVTSCAAQPPAGRRRRRKCRRVVVTVHSRLLQKAFGIGPQICA